MDIEVKRLEERLKIASIQCHGEIEGRETGHTIL